MSTKTTTVLDSIELFDKLFKFTIGQQLRHKGDTKDYTADMGLLVIARVLIQSQDEPDSLKFERVYHCRMLRFSGSGDINSFKEHELINIEEYTKQKVKDEAERKRMRDEVRVLQTEVEQAFGVNENQRVYLKGEDGAPDKSRTYRVTGFEFKEGRPSLYLTEVLMSLDKKIERETKTVSSKDEFEIVQ